ncbi:MAG TPA: serine/threonine-protein kinase [Candidatus Ratteibacteria bacterium]|nr:serine/threonine-protein kinase [bacterium]HRR95899.1 serine/threonine-protein kinase [Candidatus Ratteibacteria bacterium]
MNNEFKTKIVGEVICGYRVIDKIWQGATSTVYKGIKLNNSYNSVIAIKILHSYRNSKQYLKQFIKEYKIQKSLNHPNIVKVFGFGKQENLYCIFMEYIEGKTLRLTYDENLIQEKNLFHIIIQIGKGISYIHSKNIIHNDIKPENIIVEKSCRWAKLTDFGYAVKKSFFRRNISIQGGTENYIAPERKKGISNFKTDIYSYGMIIEELLFEKLPSEELYDIVAKTTDKVPSQRDENVDDIVNQLEKIYKRIYK